MKVHDQKIDVVRFAEEFVPDRIKFFEKDMTICLRPLRRKEFPEPTHAYFPALMVCIATMDLMGQMYTGNPESKIAGIREFVADYMDVATYTPGAIDLLWKGFRNKVAHAAHPEYVIDTKKVRYWKHPHMRVTWYVSESKDMNHLGKDCAHLLLRKKEGQIKIKPRPYEVQFDHIFYICLPSLKNDIQLGMKAFLTHLKANKSIQDNFEKIVRVLYPT